MRTQSILDSRTVVLRIGVGDLSHIPSPTIGLALGMHSSGFGLTYYSYIACVWSGDCSSSLEEMPFSKYYSCTSCTPPETLSWSLGGP